MSAGELLVRLFGGAMLVLAGLFVWVICSWMALWVIAEETQFNSLDLGESFGFVVVLGVPTAVGVCFCATGGWYLAPVVARRKIK